MYDVSWNIIHVIPKYFSNTSHFFPSILLCPRSSNHHRIGFFLKKRRGKLRENHVLFGVQKTGGSNHLQVNSPWKIGKLCKIIIVSYKSYSPINIKVNLNPPPFWQPKMWSIPFMQLRCGAWFCWESKKRNVHKMYQFADSIETQ